MGELNARLPVRSRRRRLTNPVGYRRLAAPVAMREPQDRAIRTVLITGLVGVRLQEAVEYRAFWQRLHARPSSAASKAARAADSILMAAATSSLLPPHSSSHVRSAAASAHA